MTRIKLCGLCRPEDIAAVNAALPDFVGFVFAPSRRRVTPEQAAQLRSALDPRITPVGVFVDAPPSEVAQILAQTNITWAQLHGTEDAAYIIALQAAACVAFQAVERDAPPGAMSDTSQAAATATSLCPLLSETPLTIIKAYQAAEGADYLLVDNQEPGSGKALALAADEVRTLLMSSELPVFVAGGINLNTMEAVLALKPWAIDISSGAETEGVKDANKIAALVQRVRSTQPAPSNLSPEAPSQHPATLIAPTQPTPGNPSPSSPSQCVRATTERSKSL